MCAGRREHRGHAADLSQLVFVLVQIVGIKLSFGSDNFLCAHILIQRAHKSSHVLVAGGKSLNVLLRNTRAGSDHATFGEYLPKFRVVASCTAQSTNKKGHMSDYAMTNRRPYEPLRTDSEVPLCPRPGPPFCVSIADSAGTGRVTRALKNGKEEAKAERGTACAVPYPETWSTCSSLSCKRLPTGSTLMFLALLAVFSLIIVFAVLRVQHRGRNVDPIPIPPPREPGSYSWKFWQSKGSKGSKGSQ